MNIRVLSFITLCVMSGILYVTVASAAPTKDYSCADKITVAEKILMPLKVSLIKISAGKKYGVYQITNTGNKSFGLDMVDHDKYRFWHPLLNGFMILDLNNQEKGWVAYGLGEEEGEREWQLYFSKSKYSIGIAPKETIEFAALLAPKEILQESPKKYAYRMVFDLDKLILSEPYCF